MKRRNWFYRYRFFWIGVLLSVIGLAMLYSALQYKGQVLFPKLFLKQCFWTIVAWAVFWIVANIDYHYWKGLAVPLYVLSVIMLAVVLFLGEVRYGARRWMNIGGFVFQPSEFAKISFVLMISYLLSLKEKLSVGWIIWCSIVTFIPVLLILKEPDLGTSLVLLPIFAAGLFVRGLNWRWFIVAGLLIVSLTPLLWRHLKDYQKNRLLVFLHPEMDPLGAGYTITQSRIAIGSGGLWGKGWLSGTQNQLNFLPERHTDFIFSVLAEEWGFAGSLVLITIFIYLIFSGLNVGFKSNDNFGLTLSVCISVYFFFHSFVNIAMTSGFLPVVGLPLPFISYGGTSLVISYFALGLLQAISKQAEG